MNAKLNTIFSESGCPAGGVLLKYLKGELTHDQKHDIEKHLIDCEMCSDELEGLKLISNPEKLNVIIERINNRIDEKYKTEKIKPIYYYARIAAVIFIFIAIGSLFILYNHNNHSKSDNYLAETFKKDSALKRQKGPTKISLFKSDSAPFKSEDSSAASEIFLAQNKSKPVIEEKNLISNLTLSEQDKKTEFRNTSADEVSKPAGTNIDSLALAFLLTPQNNEDKIQNSDDFLQPDLTEKQTEQNSEEIASDSNIEKVTGTKTEDLALNTPGYSTNKKAAKRSKEISKEEFKSIPVTQSVRVSEDKIQTNENLLNQAIDDYTTEKYSDAEAKLKQILQTKDFVYSQKAQWYYALTLIKLNKISQAKKVLNKIVKTTNHIYIKEAKEKLQEISNN